MITRKLIQNGTWSGPSFSDAHLILCFLIVFTLIVELGGVYLFARRKKYSNIDDLLLLVVGLNLITGVVGFLLSIVAW